MAGLTRDWADVFIEDIDERSRLERSALFFIPSAFELCREHKLSVSSMNSTATVERKKNPWRELAGRAVIGTVLHCKQPVVYDSAIRFINLANLDLPSPKRLATRDIVACAFRIGYPEIISDLDISLNDLAGACRIRKEVVDAAMKRMRISYVDAKAIWSYISEVARKLETPPENAAVVLNGCEEHFIKTDINNTYPIAVDRIGKSVSPYSKKADSGRDETAEYVYNRTNLKVAPAHGHPWAIDASPGPDAAD